MMHALRKPIARPKLRLTPKRHRVLLCAHQLSSFKSLGGAHLDDEDLDRGSRDWREAPGDLNRTRVCTRGDQRPRPLH